MRGEKWIVSTRTGWFKGIDWGNRALLQGTLDFFVEILVKKPNVAED